MREDRRPKGPGLLSQEEVRQKARALRSRAGWDPSKRVSESLQEALARLDQEARDAHAYAQAQACQACAATRAKSGDDTALCEVHLAEAMGF